MECYGIHVTRQKFHIISWNFKNAMEHQIRSIDNDSTGLWPPGSLHTMGADGHI